MKLLNYLDNLTKWLDFSWMITKNNADTNMPNQKQSNTINKNTHPNK